MTQNTDSISLELRREALLFSLRGARSSVPMLWLAVLIVLWPVRHWPAEQSLWPAWSVGLMGLASGLWRLLLVGQLQRMGRDGTDAQLRFCEHQVQANAALSGLMWATATFFILPHLNAEQLALHVCVLFGALSAASYYMSLIGRSFELIGFPMVLPLIVMAVQRGSSDLLPITVGAIVFLMAMLRATRHFRETALLALRRGLEMAAANQALQAANQQLEAESAAKWRFLATMGHEIRRPMSGVQGAMDLLSREPLTPRQRDWLSLARQSSGELLGSLTALLDYAKLEASPSAPQPQPVSLRNLCQSLVDAHMATASAKGIALRLDVAPEVPPAVLVDPDHLHQVMARLLANAIKFTERGEVSVRVRGDGPAPGLRFEVEDSGIGISPADQALLFQPYRQLDQGPQRAHGGSGLGLATSQRLVQQLGGEIQVRSGLGRGSCFGFTLQLSASALPAPLSKPPVAGPTVPALKGMVLVVEDDASSRMILTEMLTRSGLTVCEATDGLQALEALHQGGFSLVLMDGQMPRLDGYEATRQWRGLEQRLGLPRVPIVAVTANTLPADIELARECGMDDYLEKPFTMSQLLRLVARWLPPAVSIPAPASGAAAQ